MPNEKKTGKGEVPFIVKKLGEAYDGDLKPTAHVLADLLFGAWPPPPRPRQSPPKAEREPKPLRLGPGHQIVVVDDSGRERDARRKARAPGKETIPDAEILEESTNSPICSTCRDAGKIGYPGHEVPCPVCSRR
jgi:hypothetical protein